VTTIDTTPRSYTFVPPEHLGFHAELTTQCSIFCAGHRAGGGTEHPSDVSHSTSGRALQLPLKAPDGKVEDGYAMEVYLNVRPYSLDERERVPHGVFAVLDSEETPPLTPDEFGAIIDRFAAEVEHMRELHKVLVQAVAEQQGGGQ
jgi:hypothetical protein